ncbi:ATP-binding protein [Pseudonocardia sp. MCCB 268]|nr:ATP-binding protein [Pseudonocardia cytotoxica]
MVNEAVTNAVEHSGDVPDSVGPVEQVVIIAAEVEQTRAGRRLRIWVRDHGRWREPAADPEPRGLGLPLMSELTEQMLINRGEIGTG